MGSVERVRNRIAELVAASGVPEDPGHSRNTLELVGSRAGAVVRKVVVLSVSRVSPFVPV